MMSSPIIWQNEDSNVTLLDIPHSIAAAQGSTDVLLSCEPLEAPFATNEPKSAAAKAKVENNAVNENVDVHYQGLLHDAIKIARNHHQGPWCRPRAFINEPRKKKRKLGDETEAGEEKPSSRSSSALTDPDSDFRLLDTEEDKKDEGTLYFDNPKLTPTEVQATYACDGTDFTSTFRVPPGASFLLGDCTNPRSFHAAVRNQAQEAGQDRRFDFILLDPPWPNRSVKRTHQKGQSSYTIASSMKDVRQLILGTDLDILLADDCLVGVWITNKSSVRDLVLAEDGIFETWGLELEEKWIWLKCTNRGEPVTPLDGIWRKPYEVLLLGRKTKHPSELFNHRRTTATVKHRAIIGVPDLHSRKPCLKELIEPLLFRQQDYRALEVFARYLVAGWWSWGNECIKYNEVGNWRSAEDTDTHGISGRTPHISKR